jgi:aminoglycoside phosphotransferase (APT) family kinase protein
MALLIVVEYKERELLPVVEAAGGQMTPMLRRKIWLRQNVLSRRQRASLLVLGDLLQAVLVLQWKI